MRPQQGDEVGAGRAYPLQSAKRAGYQQASEVAKGSKAVSLPKESRGSKGHSELHRTSQKWSRNSRKQSEEFCIVCVFGWKTKSQRVLHSG